MEAKHPKHLEKHRSRVIKAHRRGVLHQTGGAIIVESDSSSRDVVIATNTAKTPRTPKKNKRLRMMYYRSRLVQEREASSSRAKMLPIIEKKLSELALVTALAALEDEIVKTNESTEKLISISKEILENE